MTSLIAADKSSLLTWNPDYEHRVLRFFARSYTRVGNLFAIQGYDDHHNLLLINEVFSSAPKYAPIDRTLTTHHPWKYRINRPWQKVKSFYTLDEAMAARVNDLEKISKPINLMWSGGIDSTAMLVAFLTNINDKSRLTVCYSPWSCYENPEFWSLLNRAGVHTEDISGTKYHQKLLEDAVFVWGHGGDELTGSLDNSFYNKVGYRGLQQPWKQVFAKHRPDDIFLDFCDRFFANSQREIHTLFEARWFFYAVCKNSSIFNQNYSWRAQNSKFDIDAFVSFYDCEEFESSMYHDIHQCMPSRGYRHWKYNLKKYIYAYDGNQDYLKYKIKFGSMQIGKYRKKHSAVTDIGYIAMLSDGSVRVNKSWPLVSDKELSACIGDLGFLMT